MPKRTFQPNKSKRRKSHGFRTRMSTSGGRNVIKRRIARRRKKITI